MSHRWPSPDFIDLACPTSHRTCCVPSLLHRISSDLGIRLSSTSLSLAVSLASQYPDRLTSLSPSTAPVGLISLCPPLRCSLDSNDQTTPHHERQRLPSSTIFLPRYLATPQLALLLRYVSLLISLLLGAYSSFTALLHQSFRFLTP